MTDDQDNQNPFWRFNEKNKGSSFDVEVRFDKGVFMRDEDTKGNKQIKRDNDYGIGTQGSDSLDNRYVANIHAVFFLVCLVVFIMTELGFYSQTVLTQMRIGTVIMLIITIAVQFLGRIPTVASRGFTKYIIITLTLIEALVFVTVLNFMALLLLCFPVLVTMSYHSRKLSFYAFAGSALCALFFPVLGLKINSWAIDYFYLLIWCVTGEHSDKFPAFIRSYSPSFAAFMFVGTLYCFQIIAIAYCLHSSNKRKKRTYEKQIEIVTKSRDSMLEGMASVVENRDNDTGGHIKRTSEVVRILTDELSLEDSYRDNIIKAAPLHDLGKIAIPDNVLNKPGRLTKEEFEYIKIHPQKGCDIVNTILSGLDDDSLLKVAENIALYHHEKYDGSGYPKGLKGEEIPFEAKIMAIADVYDALVSKRCYKQPMTHEKACKVIKDSMGTHFDPLLEDCFDKASSEIHRYYTQD